MDTNLSSPALAAAAAGESRTDRTPTSRRKLWDVPHRYMCSLVGTCLSVNEIRKLALRDGLCSPEIGDYDLHGLVVGTCRYRSRTSRVLQKLLERRYRPAVRRFAKARTTDELRQLWAAGVDRGDVAGPLWALLTHPSSTLGVLEVAFGDVHMLSHALGATRRIDQKDYDNLTSALEQERTRTAQLRRVLKQRDDALEAAERRAAQQELAIRELEARSADDRSREELLREVASLCETGVELRRLIEEGKVRREDAERGARRLDVQRARLVEELREVERQRNAAQEEAEAAEAHLINVLDLPEDGGVFTDRSDETLEGLRVLYVGGRTSLVPHYRAIVERQGGSFLHHDGGLEQSCAQLESLISGSEIVICPLDAISHSSWIRVKRACRHHTGAFLPVRTSSVASLVSAIRRGVDTYRSDQEPGGSGLEPRVES